MLDAGSLLWWFVLKIERGSILRDWLLEQLLFVLFVFISDPGFRDQCRRNVPWRVLHFKHSWLRRRWNHDLWGLRMLVVKPSLFFCVPLALEQLVSWENLEVPCLRLLQLVTSPQGFLWHWFNTVLLEHFGSVQSTEHVTRVATLVSELLIFDRSSLWSWSLAAHAVGGEKFTQWDLAFLWFFHSYMEALAAA